MEQWRCDYASEGKCIANLYAFIEYSQGTSGQIIGVDFHPTERNSVIAFGQAHLHFLKCDTKQKKFEKIEARFEVGSHNGHSRTRAQLIVSGP